MAERDTPGEDTVEPYDHVCVWQRDIETHSEDTIEPYDHVCVSRLMCPAINFFFWFQMWVHKDRVPTERRYCLVLLVYIGFQDLTIWY